MPIWHRLAKLSILIIEGIIQKISYERRDYESVDEKSLSLSCPEERRKKNSAGKELITILQVLLLGKFIWYMWNIAHIALFQNY